jgi:hypothetical protein
MRKLAFIMLTLATLIAVAAWSALAQPAADCDSLPPRLIVGQEGRTTGGNAVNLRAEPSRSAARLLTVPEYGMFTVLGGGACADGFRWWQVAYHHARDGAAGWIAEGDAATGQYWLEPRGTRVRTDGSNGVDRWWVVGEDGVREAEGCLAPPDDYSRTRLRGGTLNQRTLFMLDQAQRLYRAMGGTQSFRNGITQGSYTGGTLAASFGTHDAGGAVDLSVRSWTDGRILSEEIDRMIEALRAAGFAAWLRDTGQLYPNSPIHIHAIAIGDAELSPAAYEQVYGERGYLAGWDALHPDWGGPNPDQHGGPVTCRWMGV